jgi:hypothetical protein
VKIWETFQTDLISLIFTLVAAGILYLARAKAKLVWAKSHQFVFLVDGEPPTPINGNISQELVPAGTRSTPTPQINVFTASIFIQNLGTVPATEVEVTFNYPPANYNIWPVRPYEIYRSPDSRFTLKFANLAPREQFQIELLSVPKLPGVMGVMSKESVAKEIRMRATQQFSPWFTWLVWALICFGIAFILENILRIIFLIVHINNNT